MKINVFYFYGKITIFIFVFTYYSREEAMKTNQELGVGGIPGSVPTGELRSLYHGDCAGHPPARRCTICSWVLSSRGRLPADTPHSLRRRASLHHAAAACPLQSLLVYFLTHVQVHLASAEPFRGPTEFQEGRRVKRRL